MKNVKWSAGLVSLVCGIELIIAVVIGGAGIGILFSAEAMFVAGLITVLAVFGVRFLINRNFRLELDTRRSSQGPTKLLNAPEDGTYVTPVR